LGARLALAAVSASSYWWIQWLVSLLDEWREWDLGRSVWTGHLIAAAFGALVMAPYSAASRLRVVRIVAMCVASAAIYFYAIRFVVDGPFSDSTITPFLMSGGGAALLIGLSVVLLAPRRASWRLFALCLVAGIIGGAAFDESIWRGSGFAEVGGHLVWQVLVCLALHLGIRQAPG
jgi:hypothetical protein